MKGSQRTDPAAEDSAQKTCRQNDDEHKQERGIKLMGGQGCRDEDERIGIEKNLDRITQFIGSLGFGLQEEP